MDISKVTGKIEITADSPTAQIIASMQFLVGLGLSRWHLVEQDLTILYLMLCCPSHSPVDGALTAFDNVRTTDGKIILLRKVLVQVLYQDEFIDFRKEANKILKRIQTLNETKRNKIAHGMTTTLVEEGDENPYFLPFYSFPAHFRENSLTDRGFYTSIIKRQEKWDLRKLQDVVESINEAPELSRKLLDGLYELYSTHRSVVEKAGRMTLGFGLPYDPLHPLTSQAGVTKEK